MVALKPEGGGELRIGGTSYRFEPTGLGSAPAGGGLPGLIRLEGDLLPKGASRPFHMTLTVMKDGSLYMLRIERRTSPRAYPDSWAATQTTRIRALKLKDRPGGRIELSCEGSLTGILARRPENAPWSGTIWAVFPGAN